MINVKLELHKKEKHINEYFEKFSDTIKHNVLVTMGRRDDKNLYFMLKLIIKDVNSNIMHTKAIYIPTKSEPFEVIVEEVVTDDELIFSGIVTCYRETKYKKYSEELIDQIISNFFCANYSKNILTQI